ncbi:sulfide/dihydroorotate dehydrogenase-like FAD/NAD-binding protein [Peptoniphilus sp. KCTC 25270]|uniref:sulfide/dihydroorotate dehydrogenase-like FAD/NAD-binding protein n=1 Tax=Peptoniphilus sp. KCTC 25270 TaxID=2897414 RepID=UPI001E5E6592|nr:sulfide/dihydroorotate dehydrogenase-like FAD/NAD-binding protein [Peptoniphilus sp. KCTC 25270]MCD1146839.1 sulfide/dihydroorotate dehydrogenase-like FAD/NAD-binding protein [Peptoniphilus sp. KCTC 25270]
MYKVVEKKELAPSVYLLRIEAPRVAKSALPGQFVIVIADDTAERVPLTIANYNREEGWVDLVVQATGPSTKKLGSVNKGGFVKDFVGPLGVPSEFIHETDEELKQKRYLFVGGGIGAAPVYPQVRYFHERGIECDVILGFKNKDFVILEDEFKEITNHLYITTDDGSYGDKGLVTEKIDALIAEGKEYDVCVAIGPMIMMKFVSLTTKKHNLHTIVSLNPIMVDGTGMCGACRITIDGETKFACVHGPEFDAHKVDFDEAMKRQKQYFREEKTKGKSARSMEELLVKGVK